MAGKYVGYVGTYTHENSRGIHVFDVDNETGIFTEKQVVEINNPSYLTVSKDKKMLYSIADEGVASFSIDEEGMLTKVNQAWIGGMRGCYVEVDDLRRYLFVGGYHDGRVTMMKLNDDGSIGEISDGIFHKGGFLSANERRLDHPKVTCVKITPDQKYLCAVDYGLNQIKIYEIDYEFGKLKMLDIVRSELDAGCRVIRFSRDGRFAYVLTANANTIEVYSYKDDNGPVFELVQTINCLKKEYKNASCTCFRFSDEDKYIVCTIDGIEAFSFFKTNAENGTLELCGTVASSGNFPKSLCLLPGDKFVAVLNHDSNEIRTFALDYAKGCALMKNRPIPINQPNCIRIEEY